MTRRVFLFYCSSVLLAGVTSCDSPTRLSPRVEAYLTTAIDSIASNALMRDSVDWPSVRAHARELAGDATSTVGTYPAIRMVLAELGDRHSFLQLSDSLAAEERAATGTDPSARRPEPTRQPSPFGSRIQPEFALMESHGSRVGFVFMPQGRRNADFASAFQDSLRELAVWPSCGWIVDLRGNGGGNMWPMLAGLGPLLGGEDVGGSIMASGARDYWRYSGGRAVHVDSAGVENAYAAVEEPVEVHRGVPVAVLIDRGTASSGEAMAIAFRGRENARFFGERTHGASTATRGIKLADGANIVLAVSTFADRNGGVYPLGLEPDEPAPIARADSGSSRDPAVEIALRWLRDASSCEDA